MAGIAVRMTARESCDLQKLQDAIGSIEEIELKKQIIHGSSDSFVLLLVYEKCFYRIQSYASLTVLVTHHDGLQTVDIIPSGGGEYWINNSWGAEEQLAKSCVQALIPLGFAVDPEHSDKLPKNFLDWFLHF